MIPRFDRIATLYVARPMTAVIGNGKARSLPILMYHSISDTDEENVAPYFRTCTSPRTFEAQLSALAEEGFTTVSLLEAKRLLASGTDMSNRFAITFDDGFRDFHTAALPVLKRYNFSATMFVATAYVGDERQSFKNRECLTWSEIHELRAAGMDFGSHTVSHPKLVHLQWPEIESELRDSKAVLEQKLQIPSPTFAYPYAFPQADKEFSARFCALLSSLGYQVCTTTEVGRVTAADNALRWKRLPANNCDDPAFLLAKLNGAYDWFQVPQSMWKRLKSTRQPRAATVEASLS